MNQLTDFQLNGFRWRTCVLSDADHDNLIKPVVRFFATRSPFPCKVCPMRLSQFCGSAQREAPTGLNCCVGTTIAAASGTLVCAVRFMRFVVRTGKPSSRYSR